MIPPNDGCWGAWQPYYSELNSGALAAGTNIVNDVVVRPNQQLFIMEATFESDTIIATISHLGVLVGSKFFRFFSSTFAAADTLYGGRRTILLQEYNRISAQINGAAGAELITVWLHGMIRERLPLKT